jgi:cytoskeletal protein CcmA (bactofilin family)
MGIFSNRRQNEESNEDTGAGKSVAPALPAQPIGFETVLGANSVLEGTLTSGGNVRLDGTFTGTLDITGNILVGETAKINANVDARNISIAGAVRGNVTGNKVQILRTGRVWGDIVAKALTMEEGAFIDGKITMSGHSASNPTADAPADEKTPIDDAEGADADAEDDTTTADDDDTQTSTPTQPTRDDEPTQTRDD